jgi:hypothetical protein
MTNREAAADLARRAIAAAERREAGLDAEAIADRLKAAAGEDGRLSRQEAIAALEEPAERWNPFADANAREDAKARKAAETIFPSLREIESDPPPPDTKPIGSADGGEGTAGLEDAVFEWVQTEAGVQSMRVFPLDQPTDQSKGPNR